MEIDFSHYAVLWASIAVLGFLAIMTCCALDHVVKRLARLEKAEHESEEGVHRAGPVTAASSFLKER